MRWFHVYVLFLSLICSCHCAKILGFFTTPSISHQQTFQAVCKELALRGHEVTFISPHILNDTSINNLKEIDIIEVYGVFKKYDIAFLSKDCYALNRVFGYHDITRESTVYALDNKQVQELITGTESFDVVLAQAFHPLTFALATRFKVPYIGKFLNKFP